MHQRSFISRAPLGVAARLTVATLVAVQASAPVAAGTITVGGLCTLAAAIEAANTDAPAGSCPAGSGADVIELTGDVEVTTVATSFWFGPTGLPTINSKIEIRGPFVKISRPDTAPAFRLLEVLFSGDLTLRGIEVSGGKTGEVGGTTLWNRGGGIYNAGTLTLIDATVSDNEAEGADSARGGGIYSDGTLRLIASTVRSNTARSTESFAQGGGMYAISGELEVRSSTIEGNVASSLDAFSSAEGGGVFWRSCDTARIADSTIYNNIAVAPDGRAEGGGLWLFCGTVENSTVSGNQANSSPSFSFSEASGGGVYVVHRASIDQVTFRGNKVFPRPDSTGDQAAALRLSSTSTLSRSIFSSSTGPHCSGGFDDLGGNLADNGSCAPTIATGLTGVDPALADNGGATKTHALLPGSTALDVLAQCGLTSDQRGAGRIPPCDAGAYERIGCALLEIEYRTIETREVYLTCNTALVGPAVIVESTGRLEISAGYQVSLGHDFMVELGGELVAGTF